MIATQGRRCRWLGSRNATGKVSRHTLRIAGMMIQLTCTWCHDEIPFELDEAADELICSGCGIRTEFAPDPVTTFELLYKAA